MSPLALSLHFLQAQPDNRLVALAREGHTPAFEALVRRYRKELLAYCRRLQPQTGSAEDALQQTLLQAWKALNAGADIRDVRPWLYRIAHNVTLNQLRGPAAVPQDVAEAAGGQEVHQLVEQRLQARAALAGMAALPALQRDVFISATLDGASHEQVASSLGLSSGAVRGLIYRARATLRSAAAALTPSPALHWALRRAEGRAGAARAVSEMMAGGGGAGVAAAIAKGGAVLTLAGAVAGAGGVILSHDSTHHHRSHARLTHSLGQSHAAEHTAGIPAGSVPFAAIGRRPADRSSAASAVRHAAAGPANMRVQDRRSSGDDHGGSGGNAVGGHDGGAGARSDGGPSDGGPSGGSSGGSDGGSSASSGGSTSTTSGSGGGTSGGGPGPSDGGQLTTAQTASDGGSGSDGGSVSSSDGSGGSDVATTTTSGSH